MEIDKIIKDNYELKTNECSQCDTVNLSEFYIAEHEIICYDCIYKLEEENYNDISSPILESEFLKC